MLARARERAQTLRIAILQFVATDASTHRFAADADLVYSRFGVMFFHDPVAAFANLRRALRPGGRMVFVCFRDEALNSWWTVPLAAAATVVAPAPPMPPHLPGPFSLADETRLQSILRDAGFDAIVCEPLDHDLVLADNLDSAAEFCVSPGSATRAVAGATDQIRAGVRAAIRQALTRHAGPARVSLHAATWVVKALNPPL